MDRSKQHLPHVSVEGLRVDNVPRMVSISWPIYVVVKLTCNPIELTFPDQVLSLVGRVDRDPLRCCRS